MSLDGRLGPRPQTFGDLVWNQADSKAEQAKYIEPGSDASAAPPSLKQQPCVAGGITLVLSLKCSVAVSPPGWMVLLVDAN